MFAFCAFFMYFCFIFVFINYMTWFGESISEKLKKGIKGKKEKKRFKSRPKKALNFPFS